MERSEGIKKAHLWATEQNIPIGLKRVGGRFKNGNAV